MDGTKRIKKAGGELFDRYALIQRCQWHKRENVVGYLSKGGQAAFRKVLQQAYEQPTYEGANRTLHKVKKELFLINGSAVQSLEEDPEDTLTLHRLALFEQLEKGLKTTNCIEAIMALIGQRTDKVDCWRNRVAGHRTIGYRTQVKQNQGI